MTHRRLPNRHRQPDRPQAAGDARQGYGTAFCQAPRSVTRAEAGALSMARTVLPLPEAARTSSA